MRCGRIWLVLTWLVATTMFVRAFQGIQLWAPSTAASRVVTRLRAADSKVDALVVGSGISGSTAAYYLHKNKVDVLLTEAREEVGGNVITKKADGFLWEEGPNSFQPNSAILRLIKDIGLLDELVFADPKLPRFVFWKERLYALPSALKDIFFFNLLSWSGRIRAGLGVLGFIAPKPDKEETIKEFVTRHLGAEAFERIIDPFVSGVYAGDPSTLSVKAALKKVKVLEDLGFTRGVLDGAIVCMFQMAAERKQAAERDADLPKLPSGSLGSFKNGLQSIPLKIKDELGTDRIRLNHKLVNIEKHGDEWVSFFQVGPDANNISVVRSKSVLLTAPAYITADLFKSNKQNLLPEAAELVNIKYPPVASVSLAYPNQYLKKPLFGFGHLIPRAMKIRTLGTIWSSSLFPGRSPEGFSLLLSFIGGAQDPQITSLSKEEIVHQVHEDIKRILLKDDAPMPKVLGVRMWPRAIPQYELGHMELLQRVTEGEKQCPGLYLGGNYRTGISIGDCIQFGSSIAVEMKSFLKNT